MKVTKHTTIISYDGAYPDVLVVGILAEDKQEKLPLLFETSLTGFFDMCRASWAIHDTHIIEGPFLICNQ